MVYAMVLGAFLWAAPGMGLLVKAWDGAVRVHTWVTLRLMGFHEGPRARVIPPDTTVAALEEAPQVMVPHVPSPSVDAAEGEEGPFVE